LLLILMAAILLWAIALKFVAERRGRQLLKTEIGKAEESLRVEERTRLAVELHDSIAQNLTGAAFQIEAAKDATREDSESATYLSCAEQILKSCRTELRRCIWDLRSNALEEPDINKAILSTIHPVADGADVHVHFNVPRSRMSDTTAHAILRIIRELTANAVRHGRANRINIAGDFIDGQLHFTVSDNGCGFNPESCPDASTGHFGLDGIRERIDKFNGAISIDSSAGEGTRVEIRIQAPHSKPEKGN
jgi:signal transduction histidine kinase